MHKPLLLSAAAYLFLQTAQAQTPLPYSTGFDNSAGQEDWEQYRLGYESNYDWSYVGFGAVSAPNKLWHDYNVGGADTDTVRDWFVSPAFDLSAGGSVTLKVNVYSIMGSTMPADQLKVMLLVGSGNPALATSTVELADLTSLVTNTDAWTAVPAINIPATAGTSYIALKYQCSQNWFTPGIDDIAVTGNVTGITVNSAANGTSAYPVPSTAAVTIKVSDARHAQETVALTLWNMAGQTVWAGTFQGQAQVAGLDKGVYRYAVTDRQGGSIGSGQVLFQ